MGGDTLDLFGDSVYFPDGTKTKICTKCLRELPLFCFSDNQGVKHGRPNCKECLYKATKLRRELYKEQGPIPEDHACPICGKTLDELKQQGKTGFVLDHCHTSKEFRGWLCHLCNTGLGCFKDNVETLENAIIYLKSMDKEE